MARGTKRHDHEEFNFGSEDGSPSKKKYKLELKTTSQIKQEKATQAVISFLMSRVEPQAWFPINVLDQYLSEQGLSFTSEDDLGLRNQIFNDLLVLDRATSLVRAAQQTREVMRARKTFAGSNSCFVSLATGPPASTG